MIFLATRGCHCCRGCQKSMDATGETAKLEPTITPDLQHSRTPSAYERFLRVGYAFPTRTRTGAHAWHGGLGGSVLGGRCSEDASSFGAVVSQPLHGSKHLQLLRFFGKYKYHNWYSSSSICDIFSNF